MNDVTAQPSAQLPKTTNIDELLERVPGFLGPWEKIAYSTQDELPIDEDKLREDVDYWYQHAADKPLDPPKEIHICVSLKDAFEKAQAKGKEYDIEITQDGFRSHVVNVWSLCSTAQYWEFADLNVDMDIVDCSGIARMAKQCFAVVPYDENCFVIKRPKHIRMDNGVLSSDKYLAVEWEDGSGIAKWKGRDIPKAWITEGMPSVAEVMEISDIEQRRCAIEIIGWVEFLEALNAELVDTLDDPQMGTLYKVTTPNEEEDDSTDYILKYQCDTGRWFGHMMVSKDDESALPFYDLMTVQGCQNWIHSMPEGRDYAPAFRC